MGNLTKLLADLEAAQSESYVQDNLDYAEWCKHTDALKVVTEKLHNHVKVKLAISEAIESVKTLIELQ